MMKPYDPVRNGILIRPFKEEGKVLRRMVAIYHELLYESYDEYLSLLEAFRRTHRSKFGVSTSHGAAPFHALLASALVNAEEKIVTQVARMYLGPLREKLETIDEVASNTSPSRILRVLEKPPNPRDKKKMRIYNEAMRNLIIALQLILIEFHAPQEEVSRNIDAIVNGPNEAFMEPNLLPIHVFAELGGELGRVTPGSVRIFTDIEQWRKSRDEAVREKRPFYAEAEFLCRTVKTGDVRYVFRIAGNRRKEELSRWVKVNRGGKLTDVIGGKWVLLGVMPAQGGKIRLATREDVAQLSAYTRRVYWQSPFEELPDRSGVNKDSSKDYWAMKIVGRYLYEVNGRPTFMRVEQIITTMEAYLNERFSRGSENHQIYAGRRAVEHVAMDLFGHISGFAEDLKARREEIEASWLSSSNK